MSDHYTYSVSWSEEDQEHVGTCTEFPSLSHLASTREAALAGIAGLVQAVVADMRKSGEPVPEPLAERNYSGKFMARVPRALHRQLTMEAVSAGVSLNQLVTTKLATPSTYMLHFAAVLTEQKSAVQASPRGKAQPKPKGKPAIGRRAKEFA